MGLNRRYAERVLADHRCMDKQAQLRTAYDEWVDAEFERGEVLGEPAKRTRRSITTRAMALLIGVGIGTNATRNE